MPYRIAGIDVHKKMLAVVIADVAAEGKYWRAVWATLEQYWMPVMQRREVRAWIGLVPEAASPPSAAWEKERLQKRGTPATATGGPGTGAELRTRPRTTAVANSDAPEVSVHAGQGTVSKPAGVQMHIKLSGLLSDLLGVSGRRMLKALARPPWPP